MSLHQEVLNELFGTPIGTLEAMSYIGETLSANPMTWHPIQEVTRPQPGITAEDFTEAIALFRETTLLDFSSYGYIRMRGGDNSAYLLGTAQGNALGEEFLKLFNGEAQ